MEQTSNNGVPDTGWVIHPLPPPPGSSSCVASKSPWSLQGLWTCLVMRSFEIKHEMWNKQATMESQIQVGSSTLSPLPQGPVPVLLLKSLWSLQGLWTCLVMRSFEIKHDMWNKQAKTSNYRAGKGGGSRWVGGWGHSNILVYTCVNKKQVKRGLFCSRTRKARNAFRGLKFHVSGKRGWFSQNLLNFFRCKPGSSFRQNPIKSLFRGWILHLD